MFDRVTFVGALKVLEGEEERGYQAHPITSNQTARVQIFGQIGIELSICAVHYAV